MLALHAEAHCLIGGENPYITQKIRDAIIQEKLWDFEEFQLDIP